MSDTAIVLDQLEAVKSLGCGSAAELPDLRHSREHILRFFGPHQLQPSQRDSDVRLVHHHAQLGSLGFNTLAYRAGVDIRVDWVGRAQYLLVIPFAGEAELRQAGAVSVARRGSYLVIDPRETFTLHLDPAQQHLSIAIPPASLRRVQGPDTERLPSLPRGAQPVTAAQTALLDYTAFLCRQFGRMAPTPAVAEGLETTFLQLFLAAMPRSEAPMSATSGAVPRAIRLAQAFMLARLEEPVAIPDVAAAAGVSERTLSQHFRTFRATSLARWLRDQRLLQAREDLAGRGRPAASVTEVALRYGFGNVGRFSRAYHAAFGDYPSATLRGAELSGD